MKKMKEELESRNAKIKRDRVHDSISALISAALRLKCFYEVISCALCNT